MLGHVLRNCIAMVAVIWNENAPGTLHVAESVGRPLVRLMHPALSTVHLPIQRPHTPGNHHWMCKQCSVGDIPYICGVTPWLLALGMIASTCGPWITKKITFCSSQATCRSSCLSRACPLGSSCWHVRWQVCWQPLLMCHYMFRALVPTSSMWVFTGPENRPQAFTWAGVQSGFSPMHVYPLHTPG